MTQIELSLPAPASRRSDPKSSRMAAATVAGDQQQSECALILSYLRAADVPASYREVWSCLRDRIPEAVEVMRRLDDLRKAKLVTASGVKVRRCSVSKRMVQVWAVVR